MGEAIVTVLNPDGAPTPVAWTRMLAPRASMKPMPADWMTQGIAASAMNAKYGQAVNRDSAYEMLVRRLEAGAAKEAAEQEAAAEAAEQEALEKESAEAAREPATRKRTTTSRTRTSTSRTAPKSGVEKVLSSPTFWNQVIRVGSDVARTFWGTARR